VGELTTWEKLAAIQCNCTIEATLDQCLAKVSRLAGWLGGGGAGGSHRGNAPRCCASAQLLGGSAAPHAL
jgi:TAG lipase/steryl ester hydrolase/phospholipase A2/LPA acyltransferase